MASILIVEDDADSCEVIMRRLRQAGYQVECKSNGREALLSILRVVPDLVILDLFMPEMDGPSLLEIMRSYLKLQTLPVIIHTGITDSPLLDRARSLRVNTILAKGRATLDDVLRAVQEQLPRLPP
jgi:CheY-like chemotaxis protein